MNTSLDSPYKYPNLKLAFKHGKSFLSFVLLLGSVVTDILRPLAPLALYFFLFAFFLILLIWFSKFSNSLNLLLSKAIGVLWHKPLMIILTIICIAFFSIWIFQVDRNYKNGFLSEKIPLVEKLQADAGIIEKLEVIDTKLNTIIDNDSEIISSQKEISDNTGEIHTDTREIIHKLDQKAVIPPAPLTISETYFQTYERKANIFVRLYNGDKSQIQNVTMTVLIKYHGFYEVYNFDVLNLILPGEEKAVNINLNYVPFSIEKGFISPDDVIFYFVNNTKGTNVKLLTKYLKGNISYSKNLKTDIPVFDEDNIIYPDKSVLEQRTKYYNEVVALERMGAEFAYNCDRKDMMALENVATPKLKSFLQRHKNDLSYYETGYLRLKKMEQDIAYASFGMTQSGVNSWMNTNSYRDRNQIYTKDVFPFYWDEYVNFEMKFRKISGKWFVDLHENSYTKN